MLPKSKSVLIVGGTGQGRLCHYFLTREGHSIRYVFDRNHGINPNWGCKVIHEDVERHAAECDSFIVAIGGAGSHRADYSDMLLRLGLEPLSVIYKSSVIAESAIVGRGLQAMAGAVVSEFATIGDWCLLNTNSSVDHDTTIGNCVHIMPGATLAGEIIVGDNTIIGANATILPRVKIGAHCIIGAGTVVTKDVPDFTLIRHDNRIVSRSVR